MKTKLFAAVALSLAVSACGSAGAGGDDGGDGSGPIKIMQIAPYESQLTSLPFMKTSAQAAVAEINAAGGVNGRQIELLTCNEKSDANEALRCAQKASQEKVAAVVGSLTSFGPQVMPMLEKANIASIGADAITPYDAKSPASFLFDAGVPGYAAMPAIAVKNLGATRLAGVHLDAPTAGTNQEFFQMGVGLAGAEMVDNIVIPLDAIDYSQFVSRAEGKGADAIVSSLSPEANLKLWKALGASGSKLKVVASAGSVTPGVAKEAGELAEGSYVVAGTPTPDESNEWGMEYIAAMKEYEPGETVYAGVGLRAYEAVRLFKEVAQTIDGDIDNQSVFDAFGKVNGLKFAWIESLSFEKDGPIKDLPRVVSSVTFPAKIVNGQFVAEGAFDPFAN